VFDSCELRERDLCSARGVHEHLAERPWVLAVLRSVSHSHREPRSSLNSHRHNRLADGRFDDVLDVAHADAVSSRGRAIDFDVEVLSARHLLGVDVAGAGHTTHDIRNVSRKLLEHRQVIPEHLDAHF
jgi:hypothetical protein